GVPNDEGIADLLLFGASLEHLAVTVPGTGVRLVPAGPFIPDDREVWASPAWTRIVEEATANGGGLLLYMPAENTGGRHMRVAGRVLLTLTPPAEDRLDKEPIIAVVAPEPPAAAGAPETGE